MTTFSTDTRTDLNARGRRMQKARQMAEAQVWRLTDLIPALWARSTALDPEREIAKAARREAARRAADNLLR